MGPVHDAEGPQKKEIGPSLFSAMLQQLGLTRRDLED